MQRDAHVRRGLWLNWFGLIYNTLEGIVAVTAGILAGSVALVGFGIDSGIEVGASLAAQWRLRADLDHERRERVERITLRLVGVSFLALAAYVTIDSAVSLWRRERPEESKVGIALAAVSVAVMPWLVRQKRRVAPRRAAAQRPARLVVGRSGRRARDGADHREGRHRGHPRRRSLQRLSVPTRVRA